VRCKFTFKVTGTLNLAEAFPIDTKFYRYEFIRDKSLLTHLVVSVSAPDKNDWPSVIPNPAPGMKYEFRFSTPSLPFVQAEVRTLQGVLSMYGIREIDIDGPLIEWVSENDEERSQLAMNNFKRSSQQIDPHNFPPTPFDIVARSVLTANQMSEIDIPVNFFRRGCGDLVNRQYISAIYSFYFVLETLYANGKFKTAAVLQEFKASQDLRAAVQLVISDPGPLFTMNKMTLPEFEAGYRAVTIDQFIERMIKVRGFLHHHTLKRRGMWHPEEQQKHETDAVVFQAVTYNVIFDIVKGYLWQQDVIDSFQAVASKITQFK
jgi:hypothetical protein